MAGDPYRYFRIEARELVENLLRGALDAEKGAGDPELVARLLRFAHTLKGAARVVKQTSIADRAHMIEDVLQPHRRSEAPVPKEAIDAMLKLIDGMSTDVAALEAGRPESEPPAPRDRTDESARSPRFSSADLDELLEHLSETRATVSAVRSSLTLNDRARGMADALLGHLSASARKNGGASSQRAVETAAELRGVLEAMGLSLSDGIERLQRETEQSGEAAERLRLIPALSLFTTLERVARDVASAQGKRIAFEGQGGSVRLDGEVLNVVNNALVQVVRNAVAHGIEPPDERRNRGKPPQGSVRLEVSRRGGRIAFACADDGRGIDLEAVRRAAERKGVALEESSMSDSEALLRMLLGGGISTSQTVTEHSGRGIGLDVVREAAEKLGGDVSFETRPGGGVTVTLLVPSSVSSVDALIVEGGGTEAAIPLNAVKAALRLRPDDLVDTPSGRMIVLDGREIPYCPLSALLPGDQAVPDKAASVSALLVEGAAGTVAIGARHLKGAAHVVLRPLPQLAPASAIVAGVALNAKGRPRLVLDPDALVEEARRGPTVRTEQTLPSPPLLVIDDSLTTRMLEQSILESAGYEVDVAASGEEGLEKARNRRYGLFLVDVEMPGIDGFTFIERTRRDPAMKDVPSILVTSRESPGDKRRGEDVGAKDYVVKGEFNQERLLKRIRELLN